MDRTRQGTARRAMRALLAVWIRMHRRHAFRARAQVLAHLDSRTLRERRAAWRLRFGMAGSWQ